MVLDKYQLPDAPPDLQSRVHLSDEQQARAVSVLTTLSEALENLPALLSQDSELVCYSETTTEDIANRLAKVVGRIWHDGTDSLAREVLRFEEEIIETGGERHSFLIYSIHIAGALTLTLGWQLNISLTQLRAEVADIRHELIQCCLPE